jgi:hypothetical protein
MLHLQHPSTEHAKRDHANSDRSLLQDQFRERLELLLVLREDKHVCCYWV